MAAALMAIPDDGKTTAIESAFRYRRGMRRRGSMPRGSPARISTRRVQGTSVTDSFTTRATRCGALLLAAAIFASTLSPMASEAQDAGSATPAALATPVASLPSAGAAGIGDPYFPLLGNGGYDALHYTIDLNLDIRKGSIREATATIDAVTIQNLSAFNLDFRGPEIDSVSVDGMPAEWSRNGGELTIILPTPLMEGTPFQAVVSYHGRPDGGDDRFQQGWWATGSSIFAVGEPAGADVWYPVNGHPLDKATYTLIIEVPDGFEVVANGRLAEVAIVDRVESDRSSRVFTWENEEPTASYLVTFHAAKLDVSMEEQPDGITLVEAFPQDLTDREREVFALVPDMVDAFTDLFGPYPFASVGSTVFEDTSFNAALETQGLIGYDRSSIREPTVAHEVAHQWFGNSVSPARWQDIWLNEGLARYSETLWAEEAYGEEAAEMSLRRQMSSFANASRTSSGNPVLIGDPGPDHLFSEVVYAGGALMLADLRERMGDEAFFQLLREWAARHHFGNATASDFMALAEDVSSKDLDDFFEEWLFTPWTPERVADRYQLTATPAP